MGLGSGELMAQRALNAQNTASQMQGLQQGLVESALSNLQNIAGMRFGVQDNSASFLSPLVGTLGSLAGTDMNARLSAWGTQQNNLLSALRSLDEMSLNLGGTRLSDYRDRYNTALNALLGREQAAQAPWAALGNLWSCIPEYVV